MDLGCCCLGEVSAAGLWARDPVWLQLQLHEEADAL